MLKCEQIIESKLCNKAARQTIMQFFQDVPDPREQDNCKHSLYDLLFLMIMAIFSGADDIADIHEYVIQKQNQLKVILGEFTPPSYNTFWWIITRMNPDAFAKAFYTWAKERDLTDLEGKQICLDGKSLRGALNKKGKCNVHIVHAYVHENGLLIGQQKTEEKSNEITAIPILLEQLDIQGATISIDAAGCQKNIVGTIRRGGGHYVIALKKNQRNFYNEVVGLFEEARKEEFEYVLNCDFYENIEKKSGRIDKRSVAIISDPSEVSASKDWKDLQTFIEVTRESTVKGKTTEEKRYYISDLIESAEEFGRKVRAHWGVESMHWSLDMIFGEDSSRANSLHAAMNLGTLRRAALNVVKSNPPLKKKGMAKIRRQAKWNEDGSVVKEICEALFGVKFV